MDQSFMKEKAVMPLVISMAIPMTISREYPKVCVNLQTDVR